MAHQLLELIHTDVRKQIARNSMNTLGWQGEEHAKQGVPRT